MRLCSLTVVTGASLLLAHSKRLVLSSTQWPLISIMGHCAKTYFLVNVWMSNPLVTIVALYYEEGSDYCVVVVTVFVE